jgi:methenyltetrahydromethanopterin cyclohydrolase
MDYVTFMSIACFKTNHYKKSFKNILKTKEIDLYNLKRHYFNRALIIYSNLSKKDKITLIKNKNVYAQEGNS